MGLGDWIGAAPIVGGFAKKVYDTGASVVDGVVGGAEDFGQAISGENRYQYTNPNRADVNYDPQLEADARYQAGRQNSYQDQYAGQGDQYAGMAGSMANAGFDAQNRAGAQESQWMSDLDAQARGQMVGATGLARDAAMGLAPSEAAYQLQSGLDRASAAQQAQAGSARGSAAMANAQGNAAMATAGLQSDAFNQAGQMRAAEMANARGLYGNLSGQLRQSDQGRLGMGNDMAKFNRGQNDQYGLGLMGMGANYGGLGMQAGQLGLGYGQLGRGYGQDEAAMSHAQTDLDQRQSELAAGDERWRQENQSGISAANTQQKQRIAQGMAGTVMNGLEAGSSLDVRTMSHDPNYKKKGEKLFG